MDFLSLAECFEQSLDHFASALLHFATEKNLHHDFLDQLEVKQANDGPLVLATLVM